MAQLGVPSTEFADITGALGIGAINLMSLFLALDATTNVFAVVEENADTSSWAIFVAVPVLVASYVLGVLMVITGGVLRALAGQRATIPIQRAMLANPAIADHLEYECRQFNKKREILEGMVPTAILAAFPIWLEGRVWNFQALGNYLAVFAIVGALACIVLVRVLEREFLGRLADLQPTHRK